MQVYALFADGRSAAVGIELDVSPEPKVFVLGQPSRQLALAAERGVSAAYLHLRRRGRLRGQYASFCDLAGDASAAVSPIVVGESAGLAFALGFAAAAIAREDPRFRPAALAATGVVTNGTTDAAIGRVDGVAPKLAAAVAVLPAGGRVFFPAGNADQVPADTRAAATAKGVTLVPVETVAEAIEQLDAGVRTSASTTRWRRAGAAVLVLALVVAGVAVAVRRGESARAAAVRRGEFAALRAPWLFPAALAGNTRAAARRELTMIVSLRSLTAAAADTDASGMLALGPGDRYRVEIEPSRECYLYAIQVDSWGGGTVLFPNPTFSPETNPLRGGQRHVLPAGDRWLTLDDRTGRETIIVVAAPWPAEDIEPLLARIPAAPAAPTDAAEIFAAVRQRLDLRRAARLEQGLRGVAHEEIVFGHR